ncbi:MAG: methylmalonyl-CoA mutase, partial [Actinobacteria bacterium]|nr:methylmalonyl-CoA mutase [Actinomycetota bacterium]
MSGTPLKAVYGPEDLAQEAGAQGSGEYPGQYPYARGIHASMYRTKLWTTRMFAGCGTAIDTNERFRQLLDDGSEGLSTAFDVPTLMGLDSD